MKVKNQFFKGICIVLIFFFSNNIIAQENKLKFDIISDIPTTSVKDQNETKYFKVKNSWGQDGNEYGVYFYASEAYVRLKTMTIMLHKDVVPVLIKEKF